MPDGLTHVYHLYVARTARRDDIAAALKGAGWPAPPTTRRRCTCSRRSSFLGHKPGDFPVTEEAAATNLALPMHPNLTEDQVAEVARALAGVRA